MLLGKIKKGKRTALLLPTLCVVIVLLVLLFRGVLLRAVGGFLIVEEELHHSDAIVVLNTGMAYYPRLVEAEALYRQGYARVIVINGNRKTAALRNLEAKGFRTCCPWYEERVRILEILGVPRSDVITISAENAYDTISEAVAVGPALLQKGVTTAIVTTSKSHSRRACHIWKNLYQGRIRIEVAGARTDPYSPTTWWKSGRQIRWVLSEYGAWVLYVWNEFKDE